MNIKRTDISAKNNPKIPRLSKKTAIISYEFGMTNVESQLATKLFENSEILIKVLLK